MNATRSDSSKARTTGIAVIGCGYWGINYVRVLNELADACVVAVCDERAERLVEAGRRCPGVLTTKDVREAAALPECEAMVISTQAATHHELASLALKSGKHVLVEKPLATSVHDADELIALAEEQGRVLLVGHTFLYNPGVRKVKDLCAGIGRMYYLYARRTSLGPIRTDVNAIWDLAPHDVAIFMYILECMPEWVSAVGARMLSNPREDVGFVTLGFPDGIVGHIHVSWADPEKVREVVVVGSDRRIVFNDLDPLERVRVFDKGVKSIPPEQPMSFGEHSLLLRDGDITSPLVPILEPLKNQCGHFLHCIRRNDFPFTNGRQGKDVVRVMEAIDHSIARNGVPIAIRAEDRFEEAGVELAGTIR